ncbi:MAG: LCP family protein [Chloroflexota bacterium]|nr:LCP family protein [Chloroflexota bacterium]
MQERNRARFPALAAALSFLFPGLGQVYAGKPVLAALLAAPILALLLVGAIAWLTLADRLRNALFSSQFLTALLVLDVALLLWRLFAILHAGLARPSVVEHQAPQPAVAANSGGSGGAALAMGGPPIPYATGDQTTSEARRRPWEMAIVVLLVIATLGMHLWTGSVITALDGTLGRVLTGGTPIVVGAETPQPLNQPDYHWDGTQRLTFLLLGIDSGPFRSEALTDTILVVSVDPIAHSAVMISIPRDTAFMPLPDRRIYADGLYPQKINSLTTVASKNPKLWCPDLRPGADCGVRTLERSVGLYLGLEINYYAMINLVGFAKLIDSLGGLYLCLPGTLHDSSYGGPTWYPNVGITLKAGCQTMNGARALAYARIRKGTMTLPNGTVEQENDFRRAARQQEVLLALRTQFASANWIFALPSLLEAVGETVTTDFPRDQAGNLASLLPLIAGPEIKRLVLALPDYVSLAPNPQLNYLLVPKRSALRTKMKALFGADGPLQGWYLGSTSQYPPRSTS